MSATPLITRAIQLLGSEAKLASACGISQAAVWKAKRVGRVSAQFAVSIERATLGEVPRWKLRPDLWERPAAQFQQGTA